MTRKMRRAIGSIVNKAIKKVLKGVAYGRVSSLGQNSGDDGLQKSDGSIDSQHARSKAFASNRSQLTGITHEIVEYITELLSAKDTKRPGYQRLWRMIENGEIDFIVASELSRLNRNSLDFLKLFEHCDKHGVQLFILDLAFDLHTPAGRVMISMLATFAQFERETIAARVSVNCHARLINHGRINGAAPIVGLDSDPHAKGHFIANPDELHRVVQILKLYLLHASKKKVLEESKRLGLQGKCGKNLTAFMLDQILFNVAYRYRGLWYSVSPKFDGEKIQVVPLPHGPLLDLELLDQVQRLLDDPSRKHKRSGSGDYFYLLSHRLVHADGSRYTGASAKGGAYRYYHNPTQNLRIHCQDLDSVVLQTLKEHLLDNERFQALVAKGLKRSGKAPMGLKVATFDLLEGLHRLPGAAQRTFVETLVNRVIVGDGTLTIELYGHHVPTSIAAKPVSRTSRTAADKSRIGGDHD